MNIPAIPSGATVAEYVAALVAPRITVHSLQQADAVWQALRQQSSLTRASVYLDGCLLFDAFMRDSGGWGLRHEGLEATA
jgi:CelD/BcsL family acetyltransferase involved in cellulose biosynthesis